MQNFSFGHDGVTGTTLASPPYSEQLVLILSLLSDPHGRNTSEFSSCTGLELALAAIGGKVILKAQEVPRSQRNKTQQKYTSR